ncbi:unnamed protein product [Tenebrio molitor]|nr:unnamed protein product [Tenebrio molitor]
MVESILMGKDRARESHRESRRVTGETQRQREDICCGRDERPTPEKSRTGRVPEPIPRCDRRS